MIIYLCNCSDITKEFIKINYLNNDFIEICTLEEAKNHIKLFNASILLIAEIKNNKDIVFIDDLRNMGLNIISVFLIEKSNLEQSTNLINYKKFDFIDWLPLTSTNVIDDAIRRLGSNLENNLYDDNLNSSQFKDLVTLGYVYDLIYGDLSRIDMIKNVTNIIKFNRIPNIVFVLMIDDFWDMCIDLDNKQRYFIKRKALNLLKRATMEFNSVSCSLIGTDKLILLLCISSDKDYSEQDYIAHIANHIKDYIKTNSDYTVTLGISRVYNDYKDIWRAYEEAFQAINYSFSIGKNIIVQYKDIASNSNNKVNYDYIYFEYQLFKNLTSNDINLILNYYDNLFLSFINKKYKIDTIKSIINKFTYDVLNYCTDLGLCENEIGLIFMETSTKILRASSITSVKELGSEYLQTLSKLITEFTNNNNDLSLDAVIIFINKYYYKTITLSDVAHISNMSDSYFSRRFKKKFGINFVNYLLNYRLEKAYELLSESKISVKEVAEKIGFNDVPYFSKSFKNKYKISPMNLRNEVSNNDKGY